MAKLAPLTTQHLTKRNPAMSRRLNHRQAALLAATGHLAGKARPQRQPNRQAADALAARPERVLSYDVHHRLLSMTERHGTVTVYYDDPASYPGAPPADFPPETVTTSWYDAEGNRCE